MENDLKEVLVKEIILLSEKKTKFLELKNLSYNYLNTKRIINSFGTNSYLYYTIIYYNNKNQPSYVNHCVDEYKNKKQLLIKLNLLDLQYIYLKLVNNHD
jgi:hypothetical protein